MFRLDPKPLNCSCLRHSLTVVRPLVGRLCFRPIRRDLKSCWWVAKVRKVSSAGCAVWMCLAGMPSAGDSGSPSLITMRRAWPLSPSIRTAGGLLWDTSIPSRCFTALREAASASVYPPCHSGLCGRLKVFWGVRSVRVIWPRNRGTGAAVACTHLFRSVAAVDERWVR